MMKMLSVFISFPWSVFSYIDTSLYAVLCMQVQYVCIINSDLYVCSTLYFTVYVFEMCMYVFELFSKH